jgi:BMFP domain-containing protein YqiC
MNLNKMVNDALQEIQSSGAVETMVKTRLEKTIKDIVDEVFGEYHDFGKSLKEHVKTALKIDFTNLDLPEYNTLVAHTVREKLNELTYSLGVEKMKAQLDSMLADVKPEYKLSEILTDWMKEKNEDGDKDEEEITLIIETSKYGSRWISIDEDSGKSEYSCNIRMLVSDEGQLRVLKIGDKEITSKTIMWGLHDLEGTLFTIYAHGSKLTIDEEEIETSYPLSYED